MLSMRKKETFLYQMRVDALPENQTKIGQKAYQFAVFRCSMKWLLKFNQKCYTTSDSLYHDILKNTFFTVPVLQKSLEYLKELLKAGAYIDEPTKTLPICSSLYFSSDHCLKLLLKAGAHSDIYQESEDKIIEKNVKENNSLNEKGLR